MSVHSERPSWWTSDEWSTPQDVFDKIAAEHGPFDLDVCCRVETTKAPCYFTKDVDALTQPWKGRVWCNPPYSKPSLWCRKAVTEVAIGNAKRVVMLLPASTDTGWFHDWVKPFAKIEFMRGRIRFLGWEGKPLGMPKSGSIVAVYNPDLNPF